jgi:hypothetical protein
MWNSPLHLSDFDLFAEIDDLRIHESDQFQGSLFDALTSPPCWTPFAPRCLWDDTRSHPALHMLALGSPMQTCSTREISAQHDMQDNETDATLWHSTTSSILPFVQSLIHETAQMSICDRSISFDTNGVESPCIDDVLDDLLSATPDNLVRGESGPWSELSTTSNTSDSILFNALLSSIANGFAGLDKVPAGAVFKVLRKQTHMGSRLFECLKSSQISVARALADNLFRASIEACDEQAVKLILQQTKDSSIAIDPNYITCRLPDSKSLYTPIEVAARSRHFGIVQVLLAAGADINKSYGSEHGFEECGALEHAIRKWGDNKPVELRLVRVLLDHRPIVRPPLVLAAIRWGQKDIVWELIWRLQPSSHRIWFKGENPHLSSIEDAMQHLENKLALLLVKKTLNDCQNEQCLKCIRENSGVLETLLWRATETGNQELVQLLMPHIANKTMALSAVVKTGNRNLIDLAFRLGATVGGDSCYLFEFHSGAVQITTETGTLRWYSFNVNYTDLGRLRIQLTITPISEAVRLQKKHLIREFESLETPTSTSDFRKDHWGAALAAAAQLGDLSYLQSLLQRIPNDPEKEVYNALLAAIIEDEMDAAWILMDHGAASRFEPLLALIEKQNEPLVKRFLETSNHVFTNPQLLIAALKWGNELLIEDLMFMGSRSTGEVLDQALLTNNNKLITLIVQNMVSIRLTNLCYV